MKVISIDLKGIHPKNRKEIGLMADFFIHFLEIPEEESRIQFSMSHYKLPIIGCCRVGAAYHSYGFQLGVHVIEMAALVVAAYYSDPVLAAGMLTGIRVVNFATIYTTLVNRSQLAADTIPLPWLNETIKKSHAIWKECELFLLHLSTRVI